MDSYKHGTYGQIAGIGTKVAQQSQNVMVYVGTAPVHTVQGGAAHVNKPILVQNMAEARKYFGYSDDWADYTLCEAMHVHLTLRGIGPLVLINVLDPTNCKAETGGTASITPKNGRITLAGAESIVLDSVKVGEKTLGTDYTIEYDYTRQVIVITETVRGALGSEAIEISYDCVDPSRVDGNTVIGASDGEGLNTGIHAISNVFQSTGRIPSMLLCPGFSETPDVHGAMIECSHKINGHWDAYVYADMPLVDAEGAPITLAAAKEWKAANGYDQDNETVYFPMASGTDGQKYHLSVLAAANLQQLLLAQDGIPYKTASNTECGIIQNLFMGADREGRVYDDQIINDCLNKNGIASAAYVGGHWVIWGAHSASYNQEDGDGLNISEANRMMLFHISNDFQYRRTPSIDKPMTQNDLRSIISEEQQHLDALVKNGALSFGEVQMNASEDARSDLLSGDHSIVFNITTTPLAKSMTAIVRWTDEGLATYFANEGSAG